MDNDNSNKRISRETETILMALDQISQTIDVMTSVVGRLRTYVQEQDTGEAPTAETTQSAAEQLETSRTVH